MRYKKLLDRLEKEYGKYIDNDPIFIEDINKALKEYSKQGVYNLINESIEKGELIKIDRGVYKKNNKDVIVNPEDIIRRKYISNSKDVYGIYGKLSLESNFLISYQISNTIDVITNNTSSKKRTIKVGYQTVILYKSKCKITNENYPSYTLLELFNNFDIKKFNKEVISQIKRYVREKNVTKQNLFDLVKYFPAKALKNMYMSGVMDAFI